VVDVHLMIEQPERQVEAIADAGADNITVHFEAAPQLHYVLGAIRDAGCSAGGAICPGTPATSLDEVAQDVLDLALCMSVDPGWGAQSLIPAALGKLSRMKAAMPDRVVLEVDGGVHQGTVRACVEAGAEVLVTGSAVFGSPDPAAAYVEIAELAEAV
jgi:ribulose-phosphate 3-epimerase